MSVNDPTTKSIPSTPDCPSQTFIDMPESGTAIILSETNTLDEAIHMSLDDPAVHLANAIPSHALGPCKSVQPTSQNISSRLVHLDDKDEASRCSGEWAPSGVNSHELIDKTWREEIDVQSVLFQLILDDHSKSRDIHKPKAKLLWGKHLHSSAPRRASKKVKPLAARRHLRRIIVQGCGVDAAKETYLWNTARPWEPMIRVLCVTDL